MLTVNEVAERLGVSVQLVYQLVAKGKIPVYRIGSTGRGAIRFKPDDIEAFLEACRVNSPTPRVRSSDRRRD